MILSFLFEAERFVDEFWIQIHSLIVFKPARSMVATRLNWCKWWSKWGKFSQKNFDVRLNWTIFILHFSHFFTKLMFCLFEKIKVCCVMDWSSKYELILNKHSIVVAKLLVQEKQDYALIRREKRFHEISSFFWVCLHRPTVV